MDVHLLVREITKLCVEWDFTKHYSLTYARDSLVQLSSGTLFTGADPAPTSETPGPAMH